MAMPANTEAKFWSMASPEPMSGCWLWTGSFSPSGYGQYKFCDRNWRAHRLAFHLTHGDLRAVEIVRHACDNAACMNPAHLLRGTQVENIADKVTRGRQAKGERHGRHTKPHRTARGERHGRMKIDDGGVRAIRAVYALLGVTQTQIAERFGLAQSHISRIIRHESRC